MRALPARPIGNNQHGEEGERREQAHGKSATTALSLSPARVSSSSASSAAPSRW